MKALAKRTAAVLPAVVFLAVVAAGAVAGAQERVGSCKTFVRNFYNWYAARYDQPAGWLELIVKERSADFSPEMLAALRGYAEAATSGKGEISGLDLDPILNTQDNADRYVVGDIAHSGDTYRVEVYGITQGKKRSHADVIADLKFKDGHWMFVNFEYGQWRGDLLSMLKKLRDSH